MKNIVFFSILFCLRSVAIADAFSGKRAQKILSSQSSHLRRKSMASRRPVLILKERDVVPFLSEIRTPRGGGTSTPLALSPSDPASVVFDNIPLFKSIGVICATNLLGFVISILTGSFLHVDLLGAGAFGLATIPVLAGKGAVLIRVKASCIAVAIWSAKLACFLLARAVKAGHDSRVSGLLSTTGGAAAFWVASAMWGIVSSVPHTLGTTSSDPGNPIALVAGSAIFSIGLIIETLADYQKWVFKDTNPGQFCSVGLWSVSQHPNFFGNLLIWVGILIVNAPSLVEPISAGVGSSVWKSIWGYWRLALGVLSIVSMYGWFLGQANGTLTSAVELAKKKYGDDPEYLNYIEKVPLIIPRLVQFGK